MIKIIIQVENSCATDARPRGYPTYLVECECGKQFKMLKKNYDEGKHCRECANKISAMKNTLPEELRKRKPAKTHHHHMKGTKFYKERSNINGRCKYPCVNGYKNYGGRGIRVERDKFEDFMQDMYESYKEYVSKFGESDVTIDRIDVNGNYCKANCRWCSNLEQQSNKRNNHKITYKGVEYPTVKSLCIEKGLNYYRIMNRLNNLGWDIDRAIETP